MIAQPPSLSTQKVLGLDFAATSAVDSSRFVASIARQRGIPLDVHLLNAYSFVLADSCPRLRRLLETSGLNLADGKPVSWASRVGKRVVPQVRGPAFFEQTFDLGREFNLRHFLLGGTPSTLDALVTGLTRRYPGAAIVGTDSPPFGSPVDYAVQDQRIRDSDANIVWVGLGTPKQDYEARRIAEALSIVTVAVGAAFDFSAGTKKSAPRILQRFGMEWLFRLATEPRRLWRRYLIGNFAFLGIVIRRGLSRAKLD